jgi:hypothetical protein
MDGNQMPVEQFDGLPPSGGFHPIARRIRDSLRGGDDRSGHTPDVRSVLRVRVFSAVDGCRAVERRWKSSRPGAPRPICRYLRFAFSVVDNLEVFVCRRQAIPSPTQRDERSRLMSPADATCAIGTQRQGTRPLSVGVDCAGAVAPVRAMLIKRAILRICVGQAGAVGQNGP